MRTWEHAGLNLNRGWMKQGETLFARQRIRVHQCSSVVLFGMAQSVLDKGR
jgi:hypothetical protein